MAIPHAGDLAIIITVFLLPIVTYLYFTYVSPARKSSAGPLPPPTEITNIFIHPIKSCHGLTVKSAKLLPTGLDLDRHWMWVSYPDHEFQTIRQNPKMTLIRPTYDAQSDTLTITAPSPSSPSTPISFTTPAHPTQEWLTANTDPVDATIWKRATPAHAYPASLTAPFNAFFGKEVRLVYKSPKFDAPRALASNGAEAVLGRKASTCFPDLMPLLVGNEASIDELNARISASDDGDLTIDVRRFRPNILVKGDVPWDEDRWKTLRIADAQKAGEHDGFILDVTQRCARCQVPNVHPETAEKHKRQPWDTLMKYRRVDEGITYKPCFGMLCVPRGEGGEIRVGMQVEVVEVTDKHRYIPGF